MASFNFSVPKVNINSLNNEKYVKKIANSLLSLDEYLRYMFSNLDEDNFAAQFQEALAQKVTNLIVGDLMADSITVTNGINTININPDVIFEVLKGAFKTIFLDENGDANFRGTINAQAGTIAGFDIVPEDENNNGGFIYENVETGEFIRISPYSSMTGTGAYNTDYGAVDLGISEDRLNTIIHLRSDGYARFGLAALGGSVRINDYLRYEASNGEIGTDTIFYSQNFQINRDGTVTINSPDVPKPIIAMEIYDDELVVETDDEVRHLYALTKDLDGKITKITSGENQIGITWG